MSHILLDITDSQIALTSGSRLIESPGAALATSEGRLVFGHAVLEELKRRPLETRADFWSQLSTVSLTSEFAGARHSADLVYEHLKFIFNEAEREMGEITHFSVIAPSSLSQAQLELLLGIMNALGKTPASILDRALLHQHATGKAGVHLDLQWRQLIVTEVDLDQGQLTVGKSTSLPGLGYLDLLEQCLEYCADMCVEQTRFDPRRSAEAEQNLFNAIPGAFETLKHAEEAALSVNGYEFKIARSGLAFIGTQVMTAVESAPGALSVDALLANLPGIRFDGAADLESLTKASDHILSTRGTDAPLSRINSINAPLKGVDVSEPPELRESTRSPDAGTESMLDATVPTHILINSQAYSIINQSPESQAFGLIASPDRVHVSDAFRNRVNVLSTQSSHEQLHAGCRLYRDDGFEALLIRVES
jgi:hypothetical protein